MNVSLPYSNPAPHPRADFDDAGSSVSDEFDSYIDSLQTNARSRDSIDRVDGALRGTQSPNIVPSISDGFDVYIDSLQTNAGSQDSIYDASRVPRFSAVPAVRVLPLVPTDVFPSTGALAAPLHGASVPSSASVSVRVSSKSGKALCTKVKPLPKSKSLPRSSKSANSSSTTWGSLTVRVDPSGTVKRHDLRLNLSHREESSDSAYCTQCR